MAQEEVVGHIGTEDLSDYTVADLQEIASARNIEGRSGMNKSQLVDAIRFSQQQERHAASLVSVEQDVPVESSGQKEAPVAAKPTPEDETPAYVKSLIRSLQDQISGLAQRVAALEARTQVLAGNASAAIPPTEPPAVGGGRHR